MLCTFFSLYILYMAQWKGIFYEINKWRGKPRRKVAPQLGGGLVTWRGSVNICRSWSRSNSSSSSTAIAEVMVLLGFGSAMVWADLEPDCGGHGEHELWGRQHTERERNGGWKWERWGICPGAASCPAGATGNPILKTMVSLTPYGLKCRRKLYLTILTYPCVRIYDKIYIFT